MAMTFEHIRLEAGLSTGQLDEHFRSEEMRKATPFKEDVRIKDWAAPLGKRMYAYENAERDVSFGTQRRYAVLSSNHTGVIHFVSLFYALLRCAAAGDPTVRKEQLADALDTALRLKSLAAAAEAMVREAESSGLLETLAKEAWNDPNERRVHAARSHAAAVRRVQERPDRLGAERPSRAPLAITRPGTGADHRFTGLHAERPNREMVGAARFELATPCSRIM
jgi:hypothetical protein